LDISTYYTDINKIYLIKARDFEKGISMAKEGEAGMDEAVGE
jgi:hypothetical protein